MRIALEDFKVLSLAPADHGGQDHDPRPLSAREIESRGSAPASAGGSPRRSGSNSPRPAGRTAVADSRTISVTVATVLRGLWLPGPLIDRDRRLKAVDQIDVGPFQLVEELPGVDRQAFDVLPLAFGVERVEGQRTLARAAGAGDDHEAVAGDVEIDVAEVVRSRAADADALDGRGLDFGPLPVHATHSRLGGCGVKPLIVRQCKAFRKLFALAIAKWKENAFLGIAAFLLLWRRYNYTMDVQRTGARRVQDENHLSWRTKLLALGGLAAIAVGAMQIGLTRPSPQAANAPQATVGKEAVGRIAAVSSLAAATAIAQAPAGSNLVPEMGEGVESLDKAMRGTLKEYGIPGGALAVAVDGKLVVAKGYGWANVAARRPVSPHTLFCLASVSKAVTAVAVLCLVQDGKLSLDDRVYPLLGSPLPLDGFQLDSRIKQITVRQLLLHAGGFDARKGGDYMHMARKIAKQTGHKLPIPDDWLVRYVFSRPLAFAPGAEEHYSNFGFFLCSEVVQRVSGLPYEQYVRRRVLAPAGIDDMERERLGRRYGANEARRYGRDALKEFPGGRNPIGPPAGSWIGSAVDMARFLTALDGSRGKSLLSPPPLSRNARPAACPADAAEERLAFRTGVGRGSARPRRPPLQQERRRARHSRLHRAPSQRRRLGCPAQRRRARSGQANALELLHAARPRGDRSRQSLAAARSLPGTFPIRRSAEDSPVAQGERG